MIKIVIAAIVAVFMFSFCKADDADSYNLIDCNTNRQDIYINESAWYDCDNRRERFRFCIICDRRSDKTSGQFVTRTVLASFSQVKPEERNNDQKLVEFCNKLKSWTCPDIKDEIVDVEFDIHSGDFNKPKANGVLRRWNGHEVTEYR